MTENKFYVYIIHCERDLLYTGITDDIDKRLAAHLRGKGAKFTRSFKPLKILFLEEYESKSAALCEEIRIKKLNKKEKLELISKKINSGFSKKLQILNSVFFKEGTADF